LFPSGFGLSTGEQDTRPQFCACPARPLNYFFSLRDAAEQHECLEQHPPLALQAECSEDRHVVPDAQHFASSQQTDSVVQQVESALQALHFSQQLPASQHFAPATQHLASDLQQATDCFDGVSDF